VERLTMIGLALSLSGCIPVQQQYDSRYTHLDRLGGIVTVSCVASWGNGRCTKDWDGEIWFAANMECKGRGFTTTEFIRELPIRKGSTDGAPRGLANSTKEYLAEYRCSGEQR